MSLNGFDQVIDYKRVLDFLKNYHGAHYSNPDKPGIADKQKRDYLIIRDQGHNVLLEMKKIAEKCKENFNLDYSRPIKYLDASNVKVRDYLWLQLKLQGYSEIPFSISLFVEMNSGNAQYRISLEVKNKNSNKQIMEQYHSHLEVPLAAGMSYVSGSNESKDLQTLTGSQEEIKEKIKNHEFEKVQLCVAIESAANKTNEEYDKEIMSAIARLKPFYEHVIGKHSYENRRTWLLTWNPENWQWDNYKELCVSTKQGKHAVMSWTCLSKEPVVGEEVYLMKIGKQPRGIIAHGIISRESYEALHYDPVKAAEGKTANHVDVEFDWIQDYETEKILLQDELKKRIGDQEWSPQSSGISIKTGALELSEMWKKLLEGNEVASKTPKFDKNLILYGPPGTGKTYYTVIYAVAICEGCSIEEVEARDYGAVLDSYNKLKKERRIAFTTFHQSYGYEEFIEGIKPKLDKTKADLSYTIEPGVFKHFCDDVKEMNRKINVAGKQKRPPCVFVIDEINRGNISKIFGELITLIEDTKREGMLEAASATLPYSGKPFSVPDNIYILGTMNTADRSLALMDTALRRRFRFKEMMPDTKVLENLNANIVEGLNVATMLEKINDRITYLYDREHTIGHAFFTGLTKDSTAKDLGRIFSDSIIPLLQEYFYEDYQKIQLVLGDNGKKDDKLKFIQECPVDEKKLFKGNVDDVIDISPMKYIINKDAFDNIESYKEII